MPTRKARIKHASIVTAFGERLRVVRMASGMTQKDLAEKAQVTLSYVSKLEAGGAAPGLDLLERIAAALHIEIPELLPRRRVESVDRASVRERFEALLEKTGDETLMMLNLMLERLDASSMLVR